MVRLYGEDELSDVVRELLDESTGAEARRAAEERALVTRLWPRWAGHRAEGQAARESRLAFDGAATGEERHVLAAREQGRGIDVTREAVLIGREL